MFVMAAAVTDGSSITYIECIHVIAGGTIGNLIGGWIIVAISHVPKKIRADLSSYQQPITNSNSNSNSNGIPTQELDGSDTHHTASVNSYV